MSIQSHKDLLVRQKGRECYAGCFRLTKHLPRVETFGMVSQIRRAAQSIPANIAEGWGRGGPGDYIQFLKIARGSARELETHLLLCVDVEMLSAAQAEPMLALADELNRMLSALIDKLVSKRALNQR